MTGREKFEAWARAKTGLMLDRTAYPMTADEDQQYLDHDANLAFMAWQAALASQQPADDGWIYWEGGDCPVGQNQGVEVKLRGGCGDQFYDNPASYFEWSHNGLGMDIIAYRVVKP